LLTCSEIVFFYYRGLKGLSKTEVEKNYKKGRVDRLFIVVVSIIHFALQVNTDMKIAKIRGKSDE
jgi:hypothetical protein